MRSFNEKAPGGWLKTLADCLRAVHLCLQEGRPGLQAGSHGADRFRALHRACLILAMMVTAGSDARGQEVAPFNLEDPASLRWSVEVGSFAYGGPVVADGLVLVGTNNEAPGTSGVVGDRGVVMAVGLEDGALHWRVTHPKLDVPQDYPLQGVCSTPLFADGWIYYVSNDARLMALDARGLADGTDDGLVDVGWQAEGADVIWSLDLRSLGVVPHYMSASTPIVDGDRLFVVTGNGTDEAGGIPAPQAPSLLAVDRRDGTVLWSNAEASARLVDGQWSSLVMATLGGRRQVVFAGGDGWLYGLDPESGQTLWSFDGNAGLFGRRRDRGAFVATPVVSGDRIFIGLGRDPEVGFVEGALWALTIDEGSTPRVLWHRESPQFGATLSAVLLRDETVFAADLDGYVHALNASDGEQLWKFDALAPIWASPVLIDDALWIADIDGDVVRLDAGPTLKVLSEWAVERPIHRAPLVVDETLLLLTDGRLSAFGRGSTPAR